MDALDRKILAELQADGRQSLTDLAARIGLSVSPAHRRVREMERSGTILGYRAIVDPQAVGLSFEALVFVTMNRKDPATLLAFEQAVAAIPHVLLAQRLIGDPDYLLRVRTTDLTAYARLEDDVLSTLPGLQRVNSTVVVNNIVLDRPYPVDSD